MARAPGITSARARGGKSGGDPAPTEPVVAQGPFSPNPSLRIDPALGIVIIAFHDDPGKVSCTIPTERQLDAYRRSFSGNADTTTLPAPGYLGGSATTEQAAPTALARDVSPSAGKPVVA